MENPNNEPVRICEEDNVEMYLLGPSLDTGYMYWFCPECGWTEDDKTVVV